MPRARVLAVDDQRYFRELIEGVLTDQGYEVVTASNGEEALQVLERSDFDIVVTDLVMPGMDGVELVRRVKKCNPDQEIVMVTGVSDVSSATEAMKQGARDYILKPVDADLLAGSLDDILQRRRIADEHARLLSENQEYLSALALYDRAAALFSGLSLQPLGERYIEGLCLETRAQGGVLWALADSGEGRLQLLAAKGIIRVEEEPRELLVSRLGPELEPLRNGAGPLIQERPDQGSGGSALFVPLRRNGDLIGLARLSDKVDGQEFSQADQMLAQVFTRFGEQAVGSALQFRELERRSLRDAETGAYTHAYFEEIVRNEIQKANRFGRPFSIARVDLGDPRAMREQLGGSAAERWRASLVDRISGVLRSTDLLCAGHDQDFSILLPETDAASKQGLLPRLREALHAGDGPAPADPQGHPCVTVAAVTYPADGTHLDSLRQALQDSIVEQRAGGAGASVPAGSTLAETVQWLVEKAETVPPQLPSQVLDFLIDEATRRPSEQGMLFVSPGREWTSSLGAKLSAFGHVSTQTQVVVATRSATASEMSAPITWISDGGLGCERLCLLYWGERPAYALFTGEPTSNGEPTVFHTSDRALVAQLASQMRRDLDGVPEISLSGGAS